MNDRELLEKILLASDLISKSSRKGSSNYIVVNPCSEIVIQGWASCNLGSQTRVDKIKKILNRIND